MEDESPPEMLELPPPMPVFYEGPSTPIPILPVIPPRSSSPIVTSSPMESPLVKQVSMERCPNDYEITERLGRG
jgi:hypothetical protein